MVSLNVLVFLSPEISTSHRSEKSELSIGEEIEEDLSAEIEDVNTSDKVRGERFPRVLFVPIGRLDLSVKLQKFTQIRRKTIEIVKGYDTVTWSKSQKNVFNECVRSFSGVTSFGN